MKFLETVSTTMLNLKIIRAGPIPESRMIWVWTGGKD